MKKLKLQELKNEGHKLLDEYISLETKTWLKLRDKKERAYKKLGEKLGTNYGKHHFSKMYTEQEVERAIKALKKMIIKRKRKIAFMNRKMGERWQDIKIK